MKKVYSKFYGIILGMMFILMMSTCTVFAADKENMSTESINAVAIVSIEDNQTGEIQTFYKTLPDSAIKQLNETSDGETEYAVEASVNLENFINPRLSHGDINTDTFGKIFAYVHYVTQGTGSDFRIKTTKFSGDIEFSDPAFYAKNRHYVCNDSTGRYKCCGVEDQEDICPTADSWSLKSNATTYESLSSDLEASTYYKATIYCTGMSGFSQTVSVTCTLDQTVFD